MRNSIAAAALAGLFVATMALASAALQAGSLLNGTLNQNLSSNHAYVGQPVSLSNVTSDDGSGSVVGGTLYGSVTSVQKAGQGRQGKIAMVFTRLVTRSGATYAVNTTVTKTATSTKNNTLKEAGGAVAGMLVGNMIGKTIFHTAGGGIVGAAGGFLLAKNNNSDINIPAGSAVQVQINSIVRRQSH
jgi:hypothetical protein